MVKFGILPLTEMSCLGIGYYDNRLNIHLLSLYIGFQIGFNTNDDVSYLLEIDFVNISIIFHFGHFSFHYCLLDHLLGKYDWVEVGREKPKYHYHPDYRVKIISAKLCKTRSALIPLFKLLKWTSSGYILEVEDYENKRASIPLYAFGEPTNQAVNEAVDAVKQLHAFLDEGPSSSISA